MSDYLAQIVKPNAIEKAIEKANKIVRVKEDGALSEEQREEVLKEYQNSIRETSVVN